MLGSRHAIPRALERRQRVKPESPQASKLVAAVRDDIVVSTDVLAHVIRVACALHQRDFLFPIHAGQVVLGCRKKLDEILFRLVRYRVAADDCRRISGSRALIRVEHFGAYGVFSVAFFTEVHTFTQPAVREIATVKIVVEFFCVDTHVSQ